jgi:hypothetical protein
VELLCWLRPLPLLSSDVQLQAPLQDRALHPRPLSLLRPTEFPNSPDSAAPTRPSSSASLALPTSWFLRARLSTTPWSTRSRNPALRSRDSRRSLSLLAVKLRLVHPPRRERFCTTRVPARPVRLPRQSQGIEQRNPRSSIGVASGRPRTRSCAPCDPASGITSRTRCELLPERLEQRKAVHTSSSQVHHTPSRCHKVRWPAASGAWIMLRASC